MLGYLISNYLFLNEECFEAVNVWGFWGPATSQGDKKIKSKSFHQYSWNSKVGTTWISLIGWPQKTSNMYIVVYIFCWHSKPEELPKRWQSSVSPSNAATHLNHFDNFDRYSTTPIALSEKQVVEFMFRIQWLKSLAFPIGILLE